MAVLGWSTAVSGGQDWLLAPLATLAVLVPFPTLETATRTDLEERVMLARVGGYADHVPNFYS